MLGMRRSLTDRHTTEPDGAYRAALRRRWAEMIRWVYAPPPAPPRHSAHPFPRERRATGSLRIWTVDEALPLLREGVSPADAVKIAGTKVMFDGRVEIVREDESQSFAAAPPSTAKAAVPPKCGAMNLSLDFGGQP